MIIRYILECIIVGYILGCCIYGYKKCIHGNKIMAWCVGIFIFGSILIINVLQRQTVTEAFTLTVKMEKNEESKGYDAYLYGLEIDRIEIKDIKIESGNWINDGENLIFLPSGEEITEKIRIKVPVGRERKIIFTQTPFSGMVLVENETGHKAIVDLYNEKMETHKIDLPKSDNKVIILDIGIKILLFMIILFLIQVILFLVINGGWDIVINTVADTWIKYTLLMMSGFFIYFVRYASLPNVDGGGGWQNSYWFMNYELGFLSRGLIGEILSSISNYWTREQLFLLKSVVAFVFFLIVSICIARIIATWKDSRMAYLVIGIMLAYPWSGLIFRDDIRTDICIYLMYILCVIMIHFSKASIAFVPLLVAFIIFMNETTCLTVIPSIFMLVFCKFVRTKEKKHKYLSVGIAAIAIVCTLISVIYGKGGTVEMIDSFENMQAHFEGNLSLESLWAEYLKIDGHMIVIYKDYLENWHAWLSMRIINLPMFALMGMFLKNIYEKKIIKQDVHTRLVFCLLILCSFSPISAMIIATDHPRYFNLIFIFLITNILVIMKEEEIEIEMKDMYLFMAKDKKCFLPVAIVFFYFLIEAFNATNHDSLLGLVRWFQYFEG